MEGHLYRLLMVSRSINKQELPVVAMFLTDEDEMSNLYRGPSIDASYQVSVHSAKRFSEEKIFKNRPRSRRPVIFSSPCQRQCEPLPSLGVCRLLTFHILIFSSETLPPKELKFSRNAYGGHVC
jgi:hypothetical protein